MTSLPIYGAKSITGFTKKRKIAEAIRTGCGLSNEPRDNSKALNILQMEGIIYGKKARVRLSVIPIQPSITTPRSIAG